MVLIAAAPFAFLFGKFYTYANSLDEVIFGALYGVWLGTLFEIVLRDYLIGFTEKLFDRAEQLTDFDYLGYAFSATLIYACAGVIIGGLFFYIREIDPTDLGFYAQYFVNCSLDDPLTFYFIITGRFEESMLSYAFVLFFGWAATLGMLFDSRTYRGEQYKNIKLNFTGGLMNLVVAAAIASISIFLGFTYGFEYALGYFFYFQIIMMILPYIYCGFFIFAITGRITSPFMDPVQGVNQY